MLVCSIHKHCLTNQSSHILSIIIDMHIIRTQTLYTTCNDLLTLANAVYTALHVLYCIIMTHHDTLIGDATSYRAACCGVLTSLTQRYPVQVDTVLERLTALLQQQQQHAVFELMQEAYTSKGLSHHIPQHITDTANDSKSYTSLMIAIDHPSAAMRSQAVLSLATINNTATTTSDNTDIVAMNGSAIATSVTAPAVHDMMSDVSSALLRRISDTDASVVTAVCSCTALLHELIRYCNSCSNSSSSTSDETTVTTDTLVQTTVQALYHWLSQMWHQRSQVSVQASSSAVTSLLKLLSIIMPQGKFQGDSSAQLSLIVLPALLECMPSKYACVKCNSGITDSNSEALAVNWCAINCEAVKVTVKLNARLSIKLCSTLNTTTGQCSKLQQQLTVKGKKSETVKSETVRSVTDNMLELTSEALAQGVVEIIQQKLPRKAAARYNSETVYCGMLQVSVYIYSIYT
jgi:hypothetical protein